MKRPLAIIIWTVLWVALLAWQTWAWGQLGGLEALRAASFSKQAWYGVSVLLSVWSVLAFFNLSRWPIVVFAGVSVASIANAFWTGLFPPPTQSGWFQAAIGFLPIALFMATVLPSWNKMNWHVLGVLGRGLPKDGAHAHS